jgi:hypothetical protein
VVLTFMLILVLVILVVVVKYNRLDPLHIIFLWLIAAILSMDAISIIGSNLNRVELTKQFQMFWCFILYQVVLVPAITVGFINIYRTVALTVAKAVASSCVILLLVGSEYGAEWAGVWKHVRWHIWNDLLLWSCFVVACLAAQNLFVRHLPREAKHR